MKWHPTAFHNDHLSLNWLDLLKLAMGWTLVWGALVVRRSNDPDWPRKWYELGKARTRRTATMWSIRALRDD